MKQEIKEMYNETEKMNKKLDNIRRGIHFKGRVGIKLCYEEGQKLTPYNIEKLEEFCKRNVGSKRAISIIDTLEPLGYKINKDYKDITEKELKDYIHELEQRYGFLTSEMRKEILRKFYNWLELPKLAKLIERRTKPESDRLPEELLTPEDVKKLIQNCSNNRDRCLVSVLYESGCRVSELRGIKIKHIEIDNSGIAKVILIGKTGKRRIMLRDSVPYIKALKNEHPKVDDPESNLFLSNRGERIAYHTFVGFLKRLFEKASVQKPSNPHIFRHSRATYLASYLTEQQLKVYLGWAKNSQMASVYVHLSGSNIDTALLSKVYNIKEVKQEAQDNKLQPRECPRCKELNPSTHKFCGICSTPLDYDSIEAVDKIKELVGSVVSELMNKQQAINEVNTQAIAREKIAEITPLLECIAKLQNK